MVLTSQQKSERIVRKLVPILNKRCDEENASSVWTLNLEARSRTLAARHHLEGTASYLGTSADGSIRYRVPAATRSDPYIVTLSPDNNRAAAHPHTCDCLARGACKHIGAALTARDAQQRALDEARRAEQRREWYVATFDVLGFGLEA